MKHIFESKDEKITEKAFLQSLIISVVAILICIVALCSATFCWFTGETESNRNTLVSGSFDLTVSVMAGEESIPVTAHEKKEGVFVCELPAGTYTVTLELVPGSTVKGHCIVTVGEQDELHTAAIIGENTANETESELTNPFTFTLTLQQAQTVTFEPRWGVVVEPHIAHEGTYPSTEQQETDAADTEQEN